MIVTNLYTAVGVNRTCNSVDWAHNDLICYAACNSICIFDPFFDETSIKVTKVYAGHSARINTVKWIRNGSTKETEIVSGSDDGLCIYWDIIDIDAPVKYLLKGHTSGVTNIDTIYVNNILTVVTGSADSSIKLWRKSIINAEFTCFQTISLNTGICFAVRMVLLPESNDILLAFATDDDKIHLFAEEGDQYHRVECLSGHEDWVRALDFILDKNGNLLLASCSQDTFIRLWKISSRSSEPTPRTASTLLQIDERNFKVNDKNYALALESVVRGHENWVYGIQWHRDDSGNLQFLSSSMDKTMIIWTIDESDIWSEKVRVGGVGGNSLGFYGGKFRPNGKSIIGHGYQGSFHLWHQSEENKDLWLPGVVCSGHYKEVKDVAWEPSGEFLFSVSTDQTSRIHSSWCREGHEVTTYHEIARPQVHGYDMTCIAVLSRFRFASGADEKIVRTFQAPSNFVENLKSLAKVDLDESGEQILQTETKGASVPSLGLSNKAVFEDEIGQAKSETKFKDEYPENYFVPIVSKEPPPEEYLMQNTLWPEVQKLYGHGYEIFAMAATSDGEILASACKATSLQHAEILLWSTKSWKIIQKLLSHKLTVTQMKFSPDNTRLLSVSRDRRWSLFQRTSNEVVNFELIASTDKDNGVHARIIWCCSWSHDGEYFATGSRDGKMVSWKKGENKTDLTIGCYESVDVLEMKKESFTALTFARNYLNVQEKSYLVALGLDSGVIHIYSFNNNWTKLLTIDQSNAHHLTVNKLEFRPNTKKHQLASCGEDYTVRIFEFKL